MRSAGHWRQWLETERARAGAVYVHAPSRLISDVHREEDHTTGYRGRELVELLQNADDAGEGVPQGNRVAVVLTGDGLCVANTGAAFSEGGVESLMVTDNSPKRLARSRFIGNKGLGFRSVLSWTACPIVLSGELDMAFGRVRAERWLEGLARGERPLLDKIELHREEVGRQWPVPVLAVPFFLDSSTESELVEDHGPRVASTLVIARALRADGYDTVIALPFTNPDASSRVEEQLARVGRDALLFTRHLRQLTVRRGTSAPQEWAVDRAADQLLLTDPFGHVSMWRVHTRDGEVPREHWGERYHAKPPTWEVKLAVAEENEEIGDHLFCFFPTQVRFPFPVVAHATVELTQNRQNVVETVENRFVIGQLASAMAELAASLCSVADPWAGLRAVSGHGQVDPVLEKLGFAERLRQEVMARALVPLRRGGFVRPGQAKRLDKDADGWLPREPFDELTAWTNDSVLRGGLTSLVEVLDWKQVARRIEENSANLSVGERAAIVAGVRAAGVADQIAPAVLIDHEGRAVRASDGTFLPPADGWQGASLPPWSELRFLDSALVEQLRVAMRVDTIRDLSTRLRPWSVSEYSLSAVTSHLATRLRTRLTSDPELADASRREALDAYLALFIASPGTARPPTLRIELPTVAGPWRTAEKLYFAGGYEVGRITGALYAAAPDRLVAPPAAVSATAGTEVVAQFLEWAGVAKLPRDERISPEVEYRRYIARRLAYPVSLGDLSIGTASELDRCRFDACAGVEGLADILRSADPEAILAWLGEDPRVVSWERDGETKLGITPPGKHQARTIHGQRVTAYAIWKVASANWLPTEGSGKRAPSRCLLQSLPGSDLRRVLPVPSIRRDHPVLDLGPTPGNRLRAMLSRAGVARSVAELPIDDCLDLVRDLPTHDPNGRAARALYREIVGRLDGEVPSAAARQAYLAAARLRGMMGGKGDWYAPTALLHDDTSALPAALRRQIPLLDLDTKRGATKVKELLGVSSVEAQSLSVTVTTCEPDGRSEPLQAALMALRPYVLCLARSDDATKRAIAPLRNLKLLLCRRAEGTATVAGREYPFELREAGERIGAGGVVYLVADQDEADLQLTDPVMADRIGQAVSSVLRFEASADIARLLSSPLGRRRDLLAQIRGWSRAEADEELDRAAAHLDVELDVFEMVGEIPPSKPAPTRITKPSPPAPPPPDTRPDAPVEETEPPVSVQVTPTELPDSSPPRTIVKRVKPTSRSSPAAAPSGDSADPVEAERLAGLFEEAQGRFPLAVAHVQGALAPGCDVLSFRSAADRARFLDDPVGGQALIDRFIEVKARQSGSGVIDLRGNELRRADEFHDKYWLYRIYRLPNGEHELVVLQDPLHGSTRQVVEVDLFRSTAAVAFLLVGIADDAGQVAEPAR